MLASRQIILLVLALGFCTIRTSGQIVANWSDTSGNYSSAGNWSTMAVPNNGSGTFYDAVINGTGGDTITFDATGTVVNSLTLGPGETFQDNGHAPTLTIGDPTFPAAGSLTNSGTINWGSGANLILDITAGNGSIANSGAINLTNSTLTINDSGNGNTAVLSGGGTITLSSGTIAGSSGKETLQNNDNTIAIQGSGTIDNLTLVNNGTINANGTHALNPDGVNNGTINVTGTGGLVLGPALVNFGTVDINHSTLTGSYNTSKPELVFGGNLVIENGSTATLSVMNISDNFFGGPTIVRNGSTLTVGSLNNFELTLEDLAGSVVTIGGVDNTNGGLLVDHSTMNFLGGYFGGSSTGGIMTVQNGGTLNVNGGYDTSPIGSASITGKSVANILGPLHNREFSSFIVANSILNVGGDIINSDNEGFGTLTLQSHSIGVIGGSLINDFAGTVTIDQSILTVRGDVNNSIEGDCVLIIQNASTLNVLGNFTAFGPEPAMTLLDGGSIVNVAGTFTNNQGAVLMMSGTKDVLNTQGLFTNGGSVTVGSLDTLNANGGFTNSGGNVSISSSGTLSTSTYSQSSGLTDVSGNLTSHTYSQSGGSTTVEMGGVLSTTTFTATGGTVTVNGTIDPTAVEIGSGAFLQGTGKIIGNVAMEGTIMPGAPGAPGTLTILGDYEQIDSGTLDELMGPLSHSFLHASGDVALDSNSFLNIILLNGFNPLGQTLDIMDYSALVGEFSNGSSFWQDGFLWDVTYGQHDIELTAVSTPEPNPLLLLLVGLGVAAFCARRKTSKTQRLA